MPAKPAPNDPDGKRKPMPFEPRTTQTEKTGKKPVKSVSTAAASKGAGKNRPVKASNGIPEAVSRRMVRRIAFFSGIPTALGMSTFLLSYLAVSNDWVKLPTYVVLFVSVGWFGLGVLGVSYGLLSASWDEDRLGGWLGFNEFKTNLGRMTEAWRAPKAGNGKQ
jgi:hypothetical protein